MTTPRRGMALRREPRRNSGRYADRGAPRCFPGWSLRLALLATVVAATAVAMTGAQPAHPGDLAATVLVAIALGSVLMPRGALPLLLLVGIVVCRLLAAGPRIDAGLVALIALVPLVHQLAALSAAVPLRSAFPLAALRPAALRWTLAVLPTEAAVLAAHLLVG